MPNVFSFLTPYVTYVKVAIIVVLVATLAILYGMMSHYKAEVDVLKDQLITCQADNKNDVATIKSLNQDITHSTLLCNARIVNYDKTIANLQKIISLNERGKLGNVENMVGSGNSMLDALNSMYPKANSVGGLCSSASTTTSTAGSGQSSKFLYCVDWQNAVNLLYNKTLHDGREKDMETILNSYQTTTQ